MAKEGTANASRIDKQISNCKSGGGYQLLDSVLPETVDSVVTRYATEDGQSGYLRYKSGMLVQWITVNQSYPSDVEVPQWWGINFLVPFTKKPVAIPTFLSGWMPDFEGGQGELSPEGISGYFLTNSPAAVGTPITISVIAIGY